MPRRKPISNKQRKEQLQLKRAVKRGDVDPPPPSDRKGKRPAPHLRLAAHAPKSTAAADSSRKLQSSFVKLPKAFLEETKRLSASLPLHRPIPSDVSVWDDRSSGPARDGNPNAQQLTCPKRPKWRYDMSKKEVEKNEEGLFKKWIDETDAVASTWTEAPSARTEDISTPLHGEAMPRAPTSFERNLEVWRQLFVSLVPICNHTCC
jgi:hypothetical protein